MTPPPYFPILRKAGSHVTFIRRNSMFLLARHSSLVLIFQFALFWTSVEGLAQSKSAMNHTEHTASPFTLPAQVGLTIGTLDIVDSGTLTDLELAISFEGSQTGSLNELRFTLISPTGTPMILASGNGTGVGSVVGQTLFETILDDEATTSINAGVPPYIGPHQPHESLSAFDGESITGTWRLVVLNQQAWEGDITAWSLFVETDGSPPTPPPDYGTEFVATPFTLPAQVGLTIGTLDIADPGTLTDLEVAISFEGRQRSLNELRFTLISPTGTPMILASGNGTGVGSVVGQTLFETILDDEATTSINAGVPPYIGPHQPHESLSAFDGESITGTWRLVVLNQQAWEGDITAWSLFVEPPLPITRYVSTTGDDAGNACTNPGNPCATIAHAVGQANPGDTLEVEAGTYNEPGLIIDKQLNLRWEGVLVQ